MAAVTARLALAAARRGRAPSRRGLNKTFNGIFNPGMEWGGSFNGWYYSVEMASARRIRSRAKNVDEHATAIARQPFMVGATAVRVKAFGGGCGAGGTPRSPAAAIAHSTTQPECSYLVGPDW
jgi:hypothetical protein